MPYREIVPPIHVSTTYERGADGAYPGGRVVFARRQPELRPGRGAHRVARRRRRGDAVRLRPGGGGARCSRRSRPATACSCPRNMYWAFRKWLLEFAAPWGLSVEFYDNASIDDLAAEGARAPAAADLDRDAGESDLGHHRHRRGERRSPARSARSSRSTRPRRRRCSRARSSWARRLVMHSATKYLNGHSDVIAGALATARDDALWQRIRYVRGGGGAVLGPFEAWLLLRGMRTLHLARRRGVRQRAGDRAALRRPSEALARALSRTCRRIPGMRSRRSRCGAASAG